MRFILALLFFVICVINLVYNLFYEKFASEGEGLLVMGITALGIYLSGSVMSRSFGKRNRE